MEPLWKRANYESWDRFNTFMTNLCAQTERERAESFEEMPELKNYYLEWKEADNFLPLPPLVEEEDWELTEGK